MRAADVPAFVAANAGARPWDRDPVDARLVHEAQSAGGKIIDSEASVGGYPQVSEQHAAFDPNAWDLECLAPRAAAR
jgi:hypothetical protein